MSTIEAHRVGFTVILRSVCKERFRPRSGERSYRRQTVAVSADAAHLRIALE